MSEQGVQIPQSLAKKLAAARKEARTVRKRGEGGEGSDTFRFARSEDVGKEARRLQRKHGFFVVPSAPDAELTFNKGGGVLAKVRMEFEVIDAETAEGFTRKWVGSGFDRYGSGAVSIATTTATKAFMAGLLGISFEPDPEERPKAQVAEPSEPVHVLNIGSILDRLTRVGMGSDLNALNRLLGSCNLDALEGSPQPLERRSLELPWSDARRLELELRGLEKEAEAVHV